ncbi:MAG: CAP domain-containing protein [Gemmatimonadota bacterium]
MRLVLLISAATALCACVSQTTRAPEPSAPVAPPTTQSPAALVAVAEDVVIRTNAERAKLRLPALMRSPQLMRAAQLQADQMAARKTMEHDLPGATYPTMTSRINAVGYQMSSAGENIAEGQNSAEKVIASWMTSPHHRENIVATRFKEMGAGLAMDSNGRRYWAQVFARPR